MRRYITEFIGTFGLVLTIGCLVRVGWLCCARDGKSRLY
jgi:hypothetical protein